MNKLVKQAFTLIELLVVIAIIGILSGLIVVSMGNVTNSANVAKSKIFSNSLRNSLMSNIIGEWKFDDLVSPVGNTASILNSWGGANNGTLSTNSVSPDSADKLRTGTTCVFGSCLAFDGTDDHIEITSNGSGKFNFPSYTVEAWIYMSVNTGGIIWSYDYTSHVQPYYSQHLRLNTGEGVIFMWNDGSVGQYIQTLTSAFPTFNKWHHIVGTYTSGNQKIYIDGKQESTGNRTDTITYYNQEVWIGKSNTAYFNGLMDNVRFYNVFMSISQAREQYYLGLNKLLNNGSISKEDYLSRINSIAQQ
jgi:prepilin-type N-terminal cleavage/methylation domain-containing protein